MIEIFGARPDTYRAELRDLRDARAAGEALAGAVVDHAHAYTAACYTLVDALPYRPAHAPTRRPTAERGHDGAGSILVMARARAEAARRSPDAVALSSATLESLPDALAERGHAVDALKAELDFLRHQMALDEHVLAGAVRSARLARWSVMGRG